MKRLLILLLPLLFALPAAAADKKPNILFLFADDWGRYASIYAEVNGPGGINDVVRTPNFDKIAKKGVLFRHAHVNAPSCTPCRGSGIGGIHGPPLHCCCTTTTTTTSSCSRCCR
jgi:arylsulfatase A-like enzyme